MRIFENTNLILFGNKGHLPSCGLAIYNDKTLIMVDGGYGSDGQIIISFLKELNRPIDYWIITHSHADHFTSFSYAIDEGLEIKNVIHDLPSEEFTLPLSSPSEICQNGIKKFYKQLSEFKGNIINPELKTYQLGDFRFEFLKLGTGLSETDLNSNSLVFSVILENKKLLCLADLNNIDSLKLLEDYKGSGKLKSDIVVVSHHGIGGANVKLYKEVKPSIALWPTVERFYNNDEEITIKEIKDLFSKTKVDSIKAFETEINCIK